MPFERSSSLENFRNSVGSFNFFLVSTRFLGFGSTSPAADSFLCDEFRLLVATAASKMETSFLCDVGDGFSSIDASTFSMSWIRFRPETWILNFVGSANFCSKLVRGVEDMLDERPVLLKELKTNQKYFVATNQFKRF